MLLIQDASLWKIANFKEKPISCFKLRQCMNRKFLQSTTVSVAIRGDLTSPKHSFLLKTFFPKITKICPQLKELMIQDYYINKNKFYRGDFSESPEKLELRNCYGPPVPFDIYDYIKPIRPSRCYFFRINCVVPNLTCLILYKIKSMTPPSLIFIQKLKKLKELRVLSCRRLVHCYKYIKVATEEGFDLLEVLDLRGTQMGGAEISCVIENVPTLKHLYLDCCSSWKYDDLPEVIRQQQQQQFSDEDIGDYNFYHHLISDSTICLIGNNTGGVCNTPNLKLLVVRNYLHVTDSSLNHLVLNAPKLEYLDVTDTSVTRDGVELFKLQRNNVNVVSSFAETLLKKL